MQKVLLGAVLAASLGLALGGLRPEAGTVCRRLWDLVPGGLSSLRLTQQLQLAGIPVAPGTTPSLAEWVKALPRRLLSDQLAALAAVPESFPAKAAEAETLAAEENTTPAETEETSAVDSGLDIRQYLAEHTAASPAAAPRVMLYCTHSSESYIPSSGSTHVSGGKGLINEVASHLAAALTARGIPAEFVYAAHDWPSYDNSYTESRQTVNRILETHGENLWALFDIHRDSIASEKVPDTVEINGKAAARILLVVGTDQRKPHPNWRQNLAFAEAIQAAAEQMYPGLIRGITKKAGTYHQELFTGALLLEFGTDLNSLEETAYAAELLADVLAAVDREENQ